jgi:regulator of replication initiation timing
VIKAELESTKDTLQHLAAQNIKMQLETEKTNKELEKRIKAMEQVIEANKIYLSNESAIKAQTKKREGL